MRDIVLDASVAAAYFGSEPHAQAAERLLNSGSALHVPDTFFLETDNVLCKWLRRGTLNRGDADGIRGALGRVPDRIHAAGALREAAYQMAAATRQSIYDCLYVSLAEALGATMVTADRRAYEGFALSPWARRVVWIEDAARPGRAQPD